MVKLGKDDVYAAVFPEEASAYGARLVNLERDNAHHYIIRNVDDSLTPITLAARMWEAIKWEILPKKPVASRGGRRDWLVWAPTDNAPPSTQLVSFKCPATQTISRTEITNITREKRDNPWDLLAKAVEEPPDNQWADSGWTDYNTGDNNGWIDYSATPTAAAAGAETDGPTIGVNKYTKQMLIMCRLIRKMNDVPGDLPREGGLRRRQRLRCCKPACRTHATDTS